uniref:Myb/SANT-like domain-containing protein n=1 Tax=Setaria italica TaxID=4555 RepID=K3YEC6_SETIT
MSTERATWSYTYEKGLVDIVKELVNIPMFKGQNGWRNITNKFNDIFPMAYFTKQQVQEKEKELKGNYKIIKEVRKSGVGWNDTLGIIIAEPKGWEKLIKDNHKVVKFRKNIELRPYNSNVVVAKVKTVINNIESKLLILLFFNLSGSATTWDLNFASIEPTPQRTEPTPQRTELRAKPNSQRSELRAEPTPQRSISEQSNHSMASIDRNPLNVGLGGVESIEVQSAPASRNSDDQDVTGGKKRKQKDYSIEKCIDIVDAMERLSDEQKVDANEVF